MILTTSQLVQICLYNVDYTLSGSSGQCLHSTSIRNWTYSTRPADEHASQRATGPQPLCIYSRSPFLNTLWHWFSVSALHRMWLLLTLTAQSMSSNSNNGLPYRSGVVDTARVLAQLDRPRIDRFCSQTQQIGFVSSCRNPADNPTVFACYLYLQLASWLLFFSCGCVLFSLYHFSVSFQDEIFLTFTSLFLKTSSLCQWICLIQNLRHFLNMWLTN